MLFQYKAIDKNSNQREGTVEASSVDAAILAVQNRGYTILSITPVGEKNSIFDTEFHLFDGVSPKDVVMLSRQLSTLFQAQVSPLRIFRLLSAESENVYLQKVLNQVVDDLQGGSSISRALSAHPDVFSSFYVSLVRSGEQTGSLDKSFSYLADYLDRSYDITVKARNAMIYPAFVIGIFFLVMILMFTMVIPKISTILIESGQELPIYTVIVIGISDFLANFAGLIFLAVGLGVFAGYKFVKTPSGERVKDELLLSLPYIGNLQKKLILTRWCDNMSTMLQSGVTTIQALEISRDVVNNTIYKEIIAIIISDVRGGKSFAHAISEYSEIPSIMSQMVQVGEESGATAEILETLAKFYNREVNNAVDNLIGLIEPIMIVVLGLGVGVLLASVLMPIYSITGSM